MSIVKYEIFEEVIKTGNFTKASENLNVTQSTVSHAISNLEKELGITLFIREARKIHLTPDGAKAYEFIHEILNLNRKLLHTNFSASSQYPRVITIGSFSSISNYVLPQIIKQFNHLYPFIKIVVFEGTYDEIDNWISEKVIDIGFTISQNPDFISIPFLKDELLIASSTNIKIDSSDFSLREFFASNNIIMPTASYRTQIEEFFNNHEIIPNVHSYISDCSTIAKMISLDIGISIGPKLSLKAFDYIKLHELPDKHYRYVYISHLTHFENGHYVKEFIKTAREFV
ncbi:LysR family transcriptional regulator [Brevibacillus daliensis]|uniref:LysR family transcriptional regulator n=1 Tax=Brevibacillus daliensis TaxID=2892995 RepID=UPI001E4D9936|nr:LysR family transcriptional regulator [Brevibacillus daliensis]